MERAGSAEAGGRAGVIGLVACSGYKAAERCRAEDLYVSQLFGLVSGYCRLNYGEWYILSAKYGLLAPEDEVDPYDLHLSSLPRQVRDGWGMKVYRQMISRGIEKRSFDLHAGRDYAKALRGLIDMTEPLKDFTVCLRLWWYTNEARKRRENQV